MLNSFIDLNNLALSRFSPEERQRIGVHTCPGGDRDSTHSADVDYSELLPSLFELKAGNFYIALAGEKNPRAVLEIIREHMKPDQRIFVGVVSPIDPRIETPEEVRDRVLEAAKYIPIEQLGTTDDCGFSPFCDDTSTTRDQAFEKIRARVVGTALAAADAREALDGGPRTRRSSGCAPSRCRTRMPSSWRGSGRSAKLIEAKEALERRSEELAHSLAMMRATLESTTDAILVTNALGEVTGYNQKFVEMWSIPREAMDSNHHRMLVEAVGGQFENPPAFRERIEEIYATAPPETYDVLELRDGRVIERFSKTQWIEQRNVGRVWSFRDITERKWAERELREQSEWFSVTLGSIGDAVIAVDTDCCITYLNPMAEALTGWRSAEALGQPIGDILRLVQETTREPAENPVQRALAEGVVLGLADRTTLVRTDGTEIPIEDSAAPIENPPGVIIGAVMVFHDVTERRQKELALERSYQAEQEARTAAERANQAKDDFLAALSHELRTPLTPVLAILSSLRQDLAISARAGRGS